MITAKSYFSGAGGMDAIQIGGTVEQEEAE